MMINFRFDLHILGKLLLVETVAFAACAVMAVCYGESDAFAFACSALITAVASLLLRRIRVRDGVLTKKDGYLIVTSTWVVFTLFGCLPFVLGGTIPDVCKAIFETMSGFSTTGATVLSDVESVPHATLFWRCLTQWLGGLGIIVLLIAILPGLGIEGRDLYVAEVPGPVHAKFRGTFASTARRTWILYIGMTVVLAGLLLLGDMEGFDAVCHSLTTLATGGFSTKNASLGYWDSPFIHYVVALFMFLSGCNYSLLYYSLIGKTGKIMRDEEFRFYLSVVLVCSVAVAAGLYLSGYAGVERCVRDALFHVVSIITTAGYATTDYLQWGLMQQSVLFILLFVGACAGSTTGGLKCVRLLLLFRNTGNEMKRIIHPNGVINVKYNGRSVHPDVMAGIMCFFVLYILIFGIASLVMSVFTQDFETACSMVITSMSNVGCGFGEGGALGDFSYMNGFCCLFLSALMLIGRLEILTVLVLFTRSFWRN